MNAVVTERQAQVHEDNRDHGCRIWVSGHLLTLLSAASMNLGRHSISATSPVNIFDSRFDADCNIFTATTPAGFAVYRTYPLQLIRKRGRDFVHRSLVFWLTFLPTELTGGTLSAAVPLHCSNIIFLLGGGRSPLYPPNKVIVWNDELGKEIAELEFRERVRGLATRRGWLAVCLRRRVVAFQITTTITRFGEWDTFDNPRGEHLARRLDAITRTLKDDFATSCV